MDPFIPMLIIGVMFIIYLIFAFIDFWIDLIINLPILLIFGLRTYAILRKKIKENTQRYIVAAILSLLATILIANAMNEIRIWPITLLVVNAFILYYLIILSEHLHKKYKEYKKTKAAKPKQK